MTNARCRPLLASALLFAAGCGGLTAGCGGPAAGVDRMGLPLHTPVTEGELVARPESTLLYPGSWLARRVGANEHAQPGGSEPDPAYAGVIAIAPVTVTALLTWYDHVLTARGYLPATYYRPSNQVDGAAWTAPNSREQIQVGIFASTSDIAGSAHGGYLAYEEELVNYRVTGPPPS
ncbi:MAG: hypothetical protein QOJ78_645 [Pseudonocardiales bacterium]|nr:hypothetical protein [Pseudonocardiales bacterium]MDT4903323.1 hypothetical protein [Pseudonocardiales bacterium]MDT4931834.1 hypothetical protein [Pseudonocardiales bacterium]MDT5162867.1 hypothetical protein [Mycobacterium sp.]